MRAFFCRGRRDDKCPNAYKKKAFCFHRRSFQRQRADSNRRIRVLQTRPLPTWVRRHKCRRNISIFRTLYKGSEQKKLKKLSFTCEIALVEDKIARLARRTLDKKPPHQVACARRLSTGNPRTVAQGPACKLCGIQGQKRPRPHLGIRRWRNFRTGGPKAPLRSDPRFGHARSNQRKALAQEPPRKPLCRHGFRRPARSSPSSKTRLNLAVQD